VWTPTKHLKPHDLVSEWRENVHFSLHPLDIAAYLVISKNGERPDNEYLDTSDSFTTSTNLNLAYGCDGNDTIRCDGDACAGHGYKGNDLIYIDTVRSGIAAGNEGNDTIFDLGAHGYGNHLYADGGGTGSSTDTNYIYGAPGISNEIIGSSGTDYIAGDGVYGMFGTASAEGDSIGGGSGQDVIVGDYVDSQFDASTVYCYNSSTAADGDEIDGWIGADEIHGCGGDDTIDGGAQADTIDGGPGADTITGGGGDDTIAGNGTGDDSGDYIDGGKASTSDYCTCDGIGTYVWCEYDLGGSPC
jgi:Ca2+-binding RTX toxin-like protein